MVEKKGKTQADEEYLADVYQKQEIPVLYPLEPEEKIAPELPNDIENIKNQRKTTLVIPVVQR